MRTILFLFSILFTAGCTYGPERSVISIGNAVAKPYSHELAVAVDYSRVQDPTGINTFPNGGVQKVTSLEARIYLVDIDKKSVQLAASVPDYPGIPNPSGVWIDGWNSDTLYFSLRGYGGDRWNGGDLSDYRRNNYRILPAGKAEEIDVLPDQLEQQKNSGPIDETPSLRLAKRHLEIEIAVDRIFSEAEQTSIITFDPETGKPSLKN